MTTFSLALGQAPAEGVQRPWTMSEGTSAHGIFFCGSPGAALILARSNSNARPHSLPTPSEAMRESLKLRRVGFWKLFVERQQ